jgi:hypothetical protein
MSATVILANGTSPYGIEPPASALQAVVGAATAVATTATVAAIVVTPSTGDLPASDATVSISDTATPTVVELLKYCTELKAQNGALITDVSNIRAENAQLVTDSAAIRVLLNQLRTDLISLRAIKGSA